MNNKKSFEIPELSDAELQKSKKNYKNFEKHIRMIHFQLEKLMEYREKFSHDFDERDETMLERILSNLEFECGPGWSTGLKVVGVKNTKTSEHVINRKSSSQYLLERNLVNPFTIDELEKIIPVLCTTIKVDAATNKKLSEVCKNNEFTLEDLFNLKHYKQLGLKLEPIVMKNGKPHWKTKLATFLSTRTDAMIKLIKTDTIKK